MKDTPWGRIPVDPISPYEHHVIKERLKDAVRHLDGFSDLARTQDEKMAQWIEKLNEQLQELEARISKLEEA